MISFFIDHNESGTSTNDLVIAEGQKEDVKEGFVSVLSRQTQGRGRLGRTWDSPAGGAYFSVLLRPPCEEYQVPSISIVTALAVHEAMSSLGVDSALKWPNDVLVGSRKLAGISLEIGKTPKADGAASLFVVVGIGINVFRNDHGLTDFYYLEDTAKLSLDESKQLVKLDDFLGITDRDEKISHVVDIVLAKLAEEYEIFCESCALSSNQLTRYRDASALEDKEVVVRSITGEEVDSGRAHGINESGELVLRHKDGRVSTVFSGDVTLKDKD